MPTCIRQRPEIWMVLQDGSPILRGLPKAKAERQATYLAAGHEAKRAGTTIRHRHYEIVRDWDAERREDALYTEFTKG